MTKVSHKPLKLDTIWQYVFFQCRYREFNITRLKEHLCKISPIFCERNSLKCILAARLNRQGKRVENKRYWWYEIWGHKFLLNWIYRGFRYLQQMCETRPRWLFTFHCVLSWHCDKTRCKCNALDCKTNIIK